MNSFFFLTKIVKGFTRKVTNEILDKYGEAGLIEILENNPNELLSFKGIKREEIKDNFSLLALF